MTEVLKERDLQLDMKKRVEEMRRADEDDVRLRYQDAQNDFQRAEQEKNEKKARFVTRSPEKQLSDFHFFSFSRYLEIEPI